MSAGKAILRLNTLRAGEARVMAEAIQCPTRHHIIGYGDPDASMNQQTVPVFYSTQHLLDSGWVYTNSREFSPPDRSGVWVCPECAAEYKWIVDGAK